MNNECFKEVFLCSAPAYILDLNYNIVCKNRSFDRLFGNRFPSEQGDSILEFLRCWENYNDSVNRVRKVFAIGNLPKTDTEPAIISHSNYGLMKMTKMASQVSVKGEHKYWFVQYNIDHVEKHADFWADFSANYFEPV